MTENLDESCITLDEMVELLWAGIEDVSITHPDGVHYLDLIKAYANAYARFQLQRVENDLMRDSSFSAARAVAAQAAKLEALAKGL
jgi:hypothetical protein